MQRDIRRIFVVGRPRSGTTWLANILASHAAVASVKHKTGIVESLFFSRILERFGDISKRDNYIKMVDFISKIPFIKQSVLDKVFLCNIRPQSYSEVFRMLMDKICIDQGKQIWLEKSPEHSRHLDIIINSYNDCKVVAIKRKIIDQIRSEIKAREMLRTNSLTGLWRMLILLIIIWRYHSCYKYIVHFQKIYPEKIMFVNYEMLLTN